jgi:hypothetical protein
MARANVLHNPSLRWFLLGSALTAVIVCVVLVDSKSPETYATQIRPATDPSKLVINEKPSYGTVVKGSDEIKISSATPDKAASVYYGKKLDIHRFRTSFSYEDDPFIAGSLASGKASPTAMRSASESEAPWVGFTFVIQNAGTGAVGDSGNSLGYAPNVKKSVAVYFGDVSAESDFPATGFGLITDGKAPDGGTPTDGSGVDLKQREPKTIDISYDGKTLTVRVKDIYDANEVERSYPIDIPKAVGGSTAYVGFTGSTGGVGDEQYVGDWKFTAG